MGMSTEEQSAVSTVVDALAACRNLLFITGAGISADSGLPTYRGVGGLYDVEVTSEGLPIEVVLSGSMMTMRPELAWKYLGEIERACRGARFNRGHRVIAEMEEHFPRVWVFTQNVDGFHRMAGSRNVIDIHGDMHDLYCMQCGHELLVEDYRNLTIPPKCPECAGVLRPGVVLFDEILPMGKVSLMQEEMARGFDMIFSVGTTSAFPYISYPIRVAKALGITTVEINPGQTEVSGVVDIKIAHTAAETLDAVWSAYRAR